MSDLVYNPYSESFRMNPFPVYQRFLEESPVHHLEEDRWIVFRYRDARKVLCDDDLISRLISYGKEDKLSHDEVVHNASFLLSAGHETTSSLIGNGIMALTRFPAQMERLQADPSLTVNAVEEFLRFDPPLRSVPRYNRRDFQVDGITIPAGSMIIACIASANRDPEQFPNPDALEITRSNAKTHLAFSGGIHMCLGHKLARLEGAVAFAELFSRYRKIEINGEPVKRSGVTFSGMAELPVHAG